jgi:hypothetical protein
LVYAFRHRKSGRTYVGQTTRTFAKRYYSNKWPLRISNIFLKRSVEKHGKEAFDIIFLEYGIETLEELNRLEERWAIQLNAYYPKGFNFDPCGKNSGAFLSQEYKDLKAKRIAKTYKLKEVATGKTLEVTNLSKFCKARGLSVGTLRNLLFNGRLGKTYRGFCSCETTDDDIRNLPLLVNHPNLRAPFHLQKRGKHYTVIDCERFIKEHGLDRHGFIGLLCGRCDYYRGFCRQEEASKVVSTPNLMTKFEWIDLLTPENQQVRLTYPTGFIKAVKKAKNVNVNVYQLIVQPQKQSHGYRLHGYKLRGVPSPEKAVEGAETELVPIGQDVYLEQTVGYKLS